MSSKATKVLFKGSLQGYKVDFTTEAASDEAKIKELRIYLARRIPKIPFGIVKRLRSNIESNWTDPQFYSEAVGWFNAQPENKSKPIKQIPKTASEFIQLCIDLKFAVRTTLEV